MIPGEKNGMQDDVHDKLDLIRFLSFKVGILDSIKFIAGFQLASSAPKITKLDDN